MKKILFAALLAVSALAQAQIQPIANALRLDQRNAVNTAYASRFVPPQPSGSCIVTMNGADQASTPVCYPLGSALAITNGAFSVNGAAGSQGPAGPQGPQGVAGPQGIQGVAGPVGGVGPTGPRGDVGPKGDTGDIGPAGPAGAQGPIGPQGNAGATGPKGDQGIKGDTGIQGPGGAIGPMGATGATGATGLKGDAGPQGTQGIQGIQGPQGVAGTAAAPFNFGVPTARTLAVGVAYQALDPSKAAVVTVSPTCTAALTLTAGGTCTMQIRTSTAAGLTCSSGTLYGVWTNVNTGTLTIGLGLNQRIGGPASVNLRAGNYFLLCAVSGTFAIDAAVEQTAG